MQQRQTNMILRGQSKTDLEGSVHATMKMAEEIGIDSLALKRRIGDGAKLKLEATLADKIKYLEAVDQGLHEKKLQQKVSLIIGVAMILGGLAAIAAIFFSGGLALPIIALVSAIFFTAMEGIYACYDSSYLFEKLRNYCYTPSKEIQGIKALFEIIQAEEAAAPKIAPLLVG